MNNRSITPLPPADFTPEMGNYKTLQPFRYWCQKVLPLVYDDSLSYYELLCKVVNSLNEVINDVNSLPDYISELVSDERLEEILKTLLNSLEEQIASANEETSETATTDRIVGELVWLNGDLYRVIKAMDSGDKYVVGSNVEKITIELLIKEVKTNIVEVFESDNSIASANRKTGDLIWLNNNLYEITNDIGIGNKYIVGTNCRKITIAELINVEYFPSEELLKVHGTVKESVIQTGDTNIYDGATSSIIIEKV